MLLCQRAAPAEVPLVGVCRHAWEQQEHRPAQNLPGIHRPHLVSVAGFSILTLGLCWILAKDVAQEEKWVILILAAGFLLKLVYVLYTGIGTLQHDVHSFTDSTNGHAGYIRYLYTYGHLPDFDPRQEFQFYHPPLHHILSAL